MGLESPFFCLAVWYNTDNLMSDFSDYLGMSEKEWWEKNKKLFNPHELLSDKLKKYTLPTAQKDLTENLHPYHYYIAKSRKAFNNSITVHKLGNDLIDRIQNTTIEKMPDEVPEIYKRPFIIEAHDGKNTLFGDVDSIIGFYDDLEEKKSGKKGSIENFVFLYHTVPVTDRKWHDYALLFCDNELKKGTDKRHTFLFSNLFYLRPFGEKSYWDFGMVDYSFNTINKKDKCKGCPLFKNCEGKDRHIAGHDYHFCFEVFYNNIITYITVFNYYLKAENSPVKDSKTVEHLRYSVSKKGKIVEKVQDWIIRYLYIDKDKVKYKKNPDAEEESKDGKVVKAVSVRSHIRRQPYGTGKKDVKEIIIESYVANKWVREGDTKIIVDMKK